MGIKVGIPRVNASSNFSFFQYVGVILKRSARYTTHLDPGGFLSRFVEAGHHIIFVPANFYRWENILKIQRWNRSGSEGKRNMNARVARGFECEINLMTIRNGRNGRTKILLA